MKRRGVKALLTKVDPLQIYLQANSFCRAFQLLAKTDDPNVLPMIGTPVMVISAFASELFLKCLICLEAGKSPHRHHLKPLFDRLPKHIQDRVEELWNQIVVPLRKPLFDAAERESGRPVPRDFRSALKAGNNAFGDIRYSYEPEQAKKVAFYIGDLPLLLRTVTWELKPEWRELPVKEQLVATMWPQ
jgi:hypothetical protein